MGCCKNEREMYSYEYSAVNLKDMSGPKRVIFFCALTTILPTILIILPLYLRHMVFADVKYLVSESDIIEINEGLSTIFCQHHSLEMNLSFNAFQIKNLPEISTTKKHVTLKKSMNLPDDTLEYWGFYLLKGAVVQLKICSRYPGSNILIIKDEKDLTTCGLLESGHKIDPVLAKDHETVSVFFDTSKNMSSPNEMISLREYKRTQSAGLSKKKKNNTLSTDFARNSVYNQKIKRSISSKNNFPHILDRGVNHGGNAINYTAKESEDASSFENDLLSCYDGKILLNQEFPPTKSCNFNNILEFSQSQLVTHEVNTDGYYYYIFYNDNDLNSNNIFAIFDLHKPTFQYNNLSCAKKCINKTKCNFPISFMSDETVIVEVPINDTIKDERPEASILLSICKPRMSIYILFPTAVIFIILGCAFL